MALIVPLKPASQVQPQDPSDSDDPSEDPKDPASEPATEPSEEPSALTPAEHATLVPVEFEGQLTAEQPPEKNGLEDVAEMELL